MLWRKAEPAKPLNILETIAPNTRKPKPLRDTVIGQLANLNHVHDAEPSATGGSRAAQTTRDARPAAPRALELARPDAIDRVQRGTGYGNVPRPLGLFFTTELVCVDGLVTWVHDHARSCGKELQRVYSKEQAYWSATRIAVWPATRIDLAE